MIAPKKIVRDYVASYFVLKNFFFFKMVSREKYENAKTALFAWQEKCKKLSSENTSLKDQLENTLKELDDTGFEIETLTDTIKTLKKQIEVHKDKIVDLERKNMLDCANVQRLEDTCKDLRERYNELKQDYREQKNK